MENTKKYIVDGVEKGVLDLTVNELQGVIESQEVDREFLELTSGYFGKDELVALAESNVNHRIEILGYFDMNSRGNKTEEMKDSWRNMCDYYWKHLSKQRYLSNEILEKFQYHFDWKEINENLDIDIIRGEFPEMEVKDHIIHNPMYRERYGDELLKDLIHVYKEVRPLTKEEFDNYIKRNRICSDYLAKEVKLSKDLLTFISPHVERSKILENHLTPIDVLIDELKTIDWLEKEKITKSRVCNLTEDEINEYAEYLSWNHLCRSYDMSEDTIENNIDKIDWSSLSLRQNLSLEFIKKHIDNLRPELLIANNKITFETLVSVNEIAKNHSNLLMTKSDATVEYVEETMRSIGEGLIWSFIYMNENVSGDFLLDYKEKVCLRKVSRHGRLSEDFVFNNLDVLDLDELLRNDNIDLNLINKLKNVS